MSRSLKAWTRTTAFKFSLFTLLAIIGIVVLTASFLWMERNALLQERQIGARQAVETAYGVITYYQRQAESGVLTEEQAKQQAMDAIRGMRYSGQEYFWVNDMTPRMLMHPIKPELEGKDLAGMKDPNGLKLFVAFVDTVKASPTHDGYVYYLWPKPGVEQPVQKVSYVKAFTPWGWILGSGVYLDTVDAVVWGQAGDFALAAILLALVLLVLGRVLSRRLVRQLGADYLGYSLLDAIIDDYFGVLDQFNARVEDLDRQVLGGHDRFILARIQRQKQDAMRLRRALVPLREVLNTLVRGDYDFFQRDTLVYLRDAFDHTLHLIESLEAAREVISGMLDLYMSAQSNRLNVQMRVLTVITIIFMPLTLIAGIYGMNFDNMPELHWHYGYFYVMGLMLAIALGLLLVFWRRRWL